MNINSAVIEATNFLKDKSILSAQLDTEILMAKALDKNREYIILNHDLKLYTHDFYLELWPLKFLYRVEPIE